MKKEKYRGEDYYIIKRRHKDTKKQEYLAGMTSLSERVSLQ